MTAPSKQQNIKAADEKRFQLLWRAGYSEGNSLSNRIIIGSENQQLDPTVRSKFVKTLGGKENVPTANDMIQEMLEHGNHYDIMLPFNTNLCFAREYTPQITNKISTYSTLGGNSIISFGQNIRKIGLRLTIIKAAKFWIPYQAALEAMTILSGTPSRYLGSLFLNGFDQSNPAQVRKYRVVVESLTPTFREDRNTTIDYDLSMLVTYDYSTDVYGKWGKLI